MKSLIIISLFASLILISSKLEDIDFGKDLIFEKGKDFCFTADKDGGLFLKILYDGSSIVHLDLEQSDGGGLIANFPEPGRVFIRKLVKGMFYNITCYSDSNEKGTIWINPSWHELNVDLNKMYEWKLNFHSIFGLESNLTYVIDDADKNVTFKFTYNKKSTSELPNPFIVCHGEDCKGNIETYDFKKGQSYKIIVKIVRSKDGRTDAYDFPSFRFGDINGDWPASYSFNIRTNLLVISLLLMLII